MAGPESFDQNASQSITLPLQACNCVWSDCTNSMFKLRFMGVESGGALCNVATRRLVMRHTQSNGRCCGYRATGGPVLCVYGTS